MSSATLRYPAPSVRYRLVRSKGLAYAIFALQSVALINILAWILSGAGVPSSVSSAVIACVGAVWCATTTTGVFLWLRQVDGQLAWTGDCWQLNLTQGSDNCLSEPINLGRSVGVCLDVQVFMLLHLPQSEQSAWFFVARGHDPSQWLALRRAVYSPAIMAPALPDEPFQAVPPV